MFFSLQEAIRDSRKAFSSFWNAVGVVGASTEEAMKGLYAVSRLPMALA